MNKRYDDLYDEDGIDGPFERRMQLGGGGGGGVMMREETALVLRTCAPDGSSRGGFVWPELGPVECAPPGLDPLAHWDPHPECGNGLHGALWGEGDSGLLDWSPNARWLVVRVLAADIVDLGGKVKFPRGWVEHCGDRQSATRYLVKHGGAGRAVIGVTLTGGNRSTLTGGNRSTLTGGDDSTLTGGYDSTLNGGDGSTLTGGNRSTLTGGDGSTLTGGDGSTLTGGNRSTLTGGDDSTLTGGDGSTLTGWWWDGQRRRFAVAYVGEEDGIEAGVPYRVKQGRFVRRPLKETES